MRTIQNKKAGDIVMRQLEPMTVMRNFTSEQYMLVKSENGTYYNIYYSELKLTLWDNVCNFYERISEKRNALERKIVNETNKTVLVFIRIIGLFLALNLLRIML